MKPESLPAEHTIKNFPYLSQTDNYFNPGGSCNVTSIAMCLSYFGAKSASGYQLEDDYYEILTNHGKSRHSPYDLKWLVENQGYSDRFTEKATVTEIKRWLAQDKPVVIHGYFTRFGHIVVLIGYTATGFVVHDPYGEYYSTGYDRNDCYNKTKGKSLVYSYGLIERTCSPEGPGNMWCHFISK